VFADITKQWEANGDGLSRCGCPASRPFDHGWPGALLDARRWGWLEPIRLRMSRVLHTLVLRPGQEMSLAFGSHVAVHQQHGWEGITAST